MKYKIFVFRHAETYDNKRDLFSGWRDSTLTLKGITQAKEIALQLRQEQIDFAFTSHLKRACNTLNIVMKPHPKIPVFIDDRLIERCYGQYQGKSKFRVARINPERFALIHRGYDVIPPSGESLRMAENRVLSFLKQLKKWLMCTPGNIAVSCHSNSMRAIVRYFEKLTVKEMLQKEFLQNKAKIFTLSFTNPTEKSYSNTKPVWKGRVISSKVKLASDPRNVLKRFY